MSSEKHPKVKSRILYSAIIHENEVIALMHAACEDMTELEQFLKFWEEHEKVTKLTLSAFSGSETVFTISMSDYIEHVTRCIIECNGFFTSPVIVTEGEEHWSIVLPDEDTKEILFIKLEKMGKVRINNITHLDHLSMAVPVEYVEFTPKQSHALKTAHARGYYDFPKKVTSRELAKNIGVSQSTFLEHLRKAEQKIIHKMVHHL
jgi:predicted DNA binding protein